MGAMMGGSMFHAPNQSCCERERERSNSTLQLLVSSLASSTVWAWSMRPVEPKPKIDFSTGTVSIFRYGAGPNGIMRTLGQFMGASGATFGYASTSGGGGKRPQADSLLFITASSCPSAVSFDPTLLLSCNKPTQTLDGSPSSWQAPTEHPSLDPTSLNGQSTFLLHRKVFDEGTPRISLG